MRKKPKTNLDIDLLHLNYPLKLIGKGEASFEN